MESEQKKEAPPQEELTIPQTVEIVKDASKKIELVPQWQKIFRTWSFYLHGLSVVLTFFAQLLPYMGLLQPVMDDKTYAISMFLLNAAGLGAKFIKQKNLWEYPDQEKQDDNKLV